MKTTAVLLISFFGISSSFLLSQDEANLQAPETLSGRPLDYNNLARLSYQQLIKIAQSDVRSDKDAKEYRLRIQSSDATVQSKDIDLFLDLEQGPLVLVVDNEEYFTVPFREDLMEENPDLIANQPRGSLNIYVDLEVPKVIPPKITDGKVAYQELFRPLVEIQNEMRKVDPTFGLAEQQFVLEIETGEEPVKITRDLGSRTFRPNDSGKVYMIMESYLYEENPLVGIPNEAKVNVLPASQEEIDDIRSR